jgi:hypothetical protein
MKRLAFVAAVLLAVTACSKSEGNAKDTTTPSMAAPAAAATDTAMKMMDSTQKAMDTTQKMMDTTKKAMEHAKKEEKKGGKKKG